MTLKINDLHVAVGGKAILKGLTLEVRPGQVHAVMGPNGSGKSTLAKVLAGDPAFVVTQGSVTWNGQDLLGLAPEVRAREGLFLAFQYPIEIPGINNSHFLQAALNAVRKHRGLEPLDAVDFLAFLKEKEAVLEIASSYRTRGVNEGFSGGEKKRNEVLQMLVLEPRLAVLDETDSGLDIDALKIVAKGVNALRAPDRAFLVITHYQRLLDYIVPDTVHVLAEGRIVKSGDRTLALDLEKHGYAGLVRPVPETASRG